MTLPYCISFHYAKHKTFRIYYYFINSHFIAIDKQPEKWASSEKWAIKPHQADDFKAQVVMQRLKLGVESENVPTHRLECYYSNLVDQSCASAIVGLSGSTPPPALSQDPASLKLHLQSLAPKPRLFKNLSSCEHRTHFEQLQIIVLVISSGFKLKALTQNNKNKF